MSLDLEEQIDDIFRRHPEVYLNGNHALAVPPHALSAIILEIFARFGVKNINEQEADVMAANIWGNDASTDITPSLLLRFILEDYGKEGGKTLRSITPRDHTKRLVRSLRQQSGGEFKTDTSCQPSCSSESNNTPATRQPTRGRLTGRNPKIPLEYDGELQLDLPHDVTAGTGSEAPTGSSSGRGRIGHIESSGESITGSRTAEGKDNAWDFNADTPLERSRLYPVTHIARGSSAELLGRSGGSGGVEQQEFKSRSKRGQGLLQRVPRVSTTSLPRLRGSFRDQGSRLSTSRSLPDSRPYSDASGYSADQSDDQLEPVSPISDNEGGWDHENFEFTPRQNKSFSPVPFHVETLAPRRSRPSPPGQRDIKTISDSNTQTHALLPPSRSKVDVDLVDIQVSMGPPVRQNFVEELELDSRKPGSTSNCTIGTCPGIPVLRRGAIPNLSEHIHNVRGPLRAGGFCDIYLGDFERDKGSGVVEQVAMKMLRVFGSGVQVAKAKKKFQREIDLWLHLIHPHVLNFYGTYEVDANRLCMVSPWAQGGNALEYLRRNPTANRGRLLWQTSTALEYLHSGKDAPQIVHGDLKADNVLVSATGDALLGDFGLSRHIKEAISASSGSSSTCMGGNIRFMAPELIVAPMGASSPTKTTPASDVFAFASLMLQIYTENPPFSRLSEAQAMFKTVNGELPPRPYDAIHLQRGMKDCIWGLMGECWKFDAVDRPTMEHISSRIIALR